MFIKVPQFMTRYAKMFRYSNGNWTSRVITPENIGILAKSLQRKLSAFTYDGEEWRVKTK